MKNRFKRLEKLNLTARRYLLFLFQYLLMEKPRGLDFTMRNTKLLKESGGKYSGYSKTNELHLHDIFQSLSYEECRNFLDVGCGKGVVLKEAAMYPFEKITGIELLPDLVETAKKNLEKLKLGSRIECIETDAVDFKEYGDYDTFFFFNPFDETILGKVAAKITESCKRRGKTITVIYHNPRYLHIFEQIPGYVFRKKLYDPLKDYDTCIFQIRSHMSE